MSDRVSAAPEFLDDVPLTCSVGQVGDREWWCATHQRNAEDCQVVARPRNSGEFLRRALRNPSSEGSV